MESNLPLGKLNRDELYTFMGGLFVSQVWFLYLLSNGKIDLDESLYIPLGIMSWIGSTAAVFLLNSILHDLSKWIQKDITDKDYKKIEKVQYAVNVTEKRMFIHIYAVTFSSLVLVSIPAIEFLYKHEFTYRWIAIISFIGFLTALILSLVFYLSTSKKYDIFYECVKDGKCTYIEQ